MRILLAAIVLVLLPVVAIGTFMALPDDVQTGIIRPTKHPTGAAYVSLGDSYTAAPELSQQVSDNTPTTCFQSNSNYPHIVAKAIKSTSFTDVSCAQAVVRDLTHPQLTAKGSNAAQQDALSQSTRLVTIGLSGNDAKFLGYLFACADQEKGKAKPEPCLTAIYKTPGHDQLLEDVRATQPLIESMLDTVTKTAPNAQVYVVGYPQVTPGDGSSCPKVMPFTAADLAYFDEAERALNSELELAARQHAMTYVDTYTPSIGRNTCAPKNSRWIEPLDPVLPTAPIHPNPKGEMAMAQAAIKSIEKNFKQ